MGCRRSVGQQNDEPETMLPGQVGGIQSGTNSWKPWDNIHALELIMYFHWRHSATPHRIRAIVFDSIPFHPSLLLVWLGPTYSCPYREAIGKCCSTSSKSKECQILKQQLLLFMSRATAVWLGCDSQHWWACLASTLRNCINHTCLSKFQAYLSSSYHCHFLLTTSLMLWLTLQGSWLPKCTQLELCNCDKNSLKESHLITNWCSTSIVQAFYSLGLQSWPLVSSSISFFEV